MEREERRKRIIARGTDRMAVITGRNDNLNPISKSCSFNSPRHDYLSSSMHARTTSEPVQTNDHHQAFFQDYHRGGDDPDTPIKRDKNHEEIVKPNTSTNKASNLEKINEKEVSNYPQKPLIHHILTITPKEINSSIIASEDARVICSIVVAILVVLSHVNLPHNVEKSKSVIAYRPLCMVLLTDVLIVCACVALYARCREEGDNEARVEEDGENWDVTFKLLEWGLVIYQTVCALFVDCSFYLAIVVCGLCVV